MRNIQFILGGFFGLVFLLFTYWQLNDPDPILWVPIYATAVYTSIQAMRGKTNPELLIVLFFLSVFAGLQLWVEMTAWEGFLTDGLSMKTHNQELAREAVGLWIASGSFALFYGLEKRNKMLDLGFVSAILPNKSLFEVLDYAQQQHFACVEVMCWPSSSADARRYAGVSHISVDKLSNEDLIVLKSKLALHPVKISALGYYPNPLDPDETQAAFYREHIKKIIQAAAVLGISRVNTFVGRDYTKNVAHNISRFTEVWPEIIALADSLHIKIGIENCPMFFTDDEWPGGKNLMTTPKIWDELFTIIPSSNFGLNYDPSHMVFQMMDYTYPIYHYSERIHHVHLKDVKVYPEKLNRVGILANPLEYHSPKIPGLGDIHWGKFISALNDVRYRGPIVIEVEDKAYEGSEEDIDKAIRSARNHMQQFLP